MLIGTLFVVCFLLNTLFVLFFAVELVIATTGAILLHLKLEKHHWFFSFRVQTIVDLFELLILRFLDAQQIDSKNAIVTFP